MDTVIADSDTVEATHTDERDSLGFFASGNKIARKNGQPRKKAYLAGEMIEAGARYVSQRTGNLGLPALLDDCLFEDKHRFLAEMVKLQPKNVAISQQQRSLVVHMVTDERDVTALTIAPVRPTVALPAPNVP